MTDISQFTFYDLKYNVDLSFVNIIFKTYLITLISEGIKGLL
jgi:hypothetical protein